MSRKSTSLVLSLALVATLVGGYAAAAETAERILSQEELLAKDGSLSVENLLGSIKVGPTRDGGRKLEIRARVVAEAATPEEARALVDSIDLVRTSDGSMASFHVAFPVDQHSVFHVPKSEAEGLMAKWVTPLLRKGTVAVPYEGGTVEVGHRKGSTGLAVHLEILAPFDVQATFRQLVGSLTCSALRGDLILENVEGSVRAEQIYGNLNASSQSGGLSVWKFHGERLYLKNVSGEMEFLDVNAKETRLTSETGRIQGQALIGGSVRADSREGAVELEDVDPTKLEVKSGSGRVDLASDFRHTREGSIRTDTGDVTVRVGRLASFDLQAEADPKSIKTKGVKLDTHTTDAGHTRLQRGRGGVSLQIRAGSGGVTLKSR